MADGEAEQFPPNTAAHIYRPDGTVKVVIAAEMDGKHPIRWAKDYYIGKYVVTGYEHHEEGHYLRINMRDITRADWNAINVRFPDGSYYNMSDEVTERPADYVDSLDKEVDTNDEDEKYTLCNFEFNEETRNFEVELGPQFVTLAFQTGENNENEARENFNGDECNYMEEIERDYGDEYDIEEGEYDESEGDVKVFLRELTARERRERRQARARQEREARERLLREAREANLRIRRTLPSLYVAANAQNGITYNNISNGNLMANFHGEYNVGRYYKKASVNQLMAGRESTRKNPYTRVAIAPENITHYRAKKMTRNNNVIGNNAGNSSNASNGSNNNATAGGRRKRKTRRNRRRSRK
jgi:hypothetical protein